MLRRLVLAMKTHKCLYCKKEIEVGRYGHLRLHKDGNRGCVGSGQTVYRMSKDEESLDMMKKLRKAPS